jgi:thioesterase domain-containing protein/acyl carrier protein
MVPAIFEVVDQMPLTVSGKIDRKKLIQSMLSDADRSIMYVKPVSKTETQVACIWERVLNLSRIGRFDNFFNLGGHSLLALELLGKIHNHFNVSIVLSDLLRFKTLLELSQYIDEKKNTSNTISNKNRNIVLLNNKLNNKVPLFLIHPVGGTIFCYIPIANILSNKVSVYGIEDPDIHHRKFSFNSIEELATHYIKQITSIYKKGKYFIGGASFGGTLAVEIARQLEENKDDRCVGILLLDAWAYMGNTILSQGYLKKAMLRQYKRLKRLLANKNIPNPEALFRLNLNRMLLNRQYKPTKKICKHKVFLFKAKELPQAYQAIEQPTNYWNNYIENLAVYQVTGNHETLFLPPNVSTLARLILEIVHPFKEQ